jgi:hypothetical protein
MGLDIEETTNDNFSGMGPNVVDDCRNTDSNFFCSRPQISTKTGSLRFGNKYNKGNGLVKSLVIRTGVKPEGKKYLPGLSRYPGNTRDSLTGSDKVRLIPGSFPPDLGLTSLGCQNRKGYLKTSSDVSFHTFRLSFCQSLCSVVSSKYSGLRVVFVLELLWSGLVSGLEGGSCFSSKREYD